MVRPVELMFTLLAMLAASCGFTVPDGSEPDTVSHAGMELPQYSDAEDIVVHTGYTASYNHTTLTPDWVAWELTAAELNDAYDFECSFSWDPTVERPKAMREDYSRSGWDKGHMAPRADMKWSATALEESYFFTNICPQDHEMNAQAWRKIEELTRRLARRYGSVLVVCGPIYDSVPHRHIGPNCVHVPDRFYKALAVSVGGEWQAVAFLVDNNHQNRSPRTYAVTIDSVEAVIGRNLFPAIGEAAEMQYDWKTWNK